jgi:aspartate aminotransferase
MHPTPEVARCLEPQERFERLRAHHVRRTGGRILDLAYPNAEVLAPGVRDALRDTIDEIRGRDLQYTPYGGVTHARRLVAHALKRTHGHGFRHDDVVLTPGAMAALSIVLAASRQDERDEAVVVSPCWLDTPLYCWQQGLRPVLAPVDREGGHLDLARIEAALSSRTRAVVLTQPANPTGVLYGERELRALATMLASMERPPLLISDECHRDYVFGPEPFVSPAALYPRTAILCSFGKRWLVQGQRLGYAAFTPALRAEGWSERATRLSRAMGHATPTALMQRALPRLLELELDRATFARRRQLAVRMLERMGYAPGAGRHTMFVYASAPTEDDFAFAEEAASAGVLVLPSSLFYEPGRFRIAITAPDETLARGLDALARLRREAA